MNVHDEKWIDQIMKEEDHLDQICESVCPNWWHCRGETAANGYIDTFACKDHYCTNLLFIRSYTDEELVAALRAQCEAANSQGDFPCSEYERRSEHA